MAERVARRAIGRMCGYPESKAFAGSYLADQLPVPMAPAGGGAFTTVQPSAHSRTDAKVIERFVGCRVRFGRGRGHRVPIA